MTKRDFIEMAIAGAITGLAVGLAWWVGLQ